ncbi:tRNA intron endonuclease [Piptocephalis cylindrospora]|uniref:tRNA-intron lyase n=1 Tax=Piptocephalis cylindrospora TaxID=1907219 RepID=A0A4P9Y9E3_9FUNG|nr:tRNA intron endonuclease [Piptocephalis cylindrospora]|eukprot:RKP15464.1 tRNA intron endonuclease [Piptocephalis cylindrospora]
MTQKDLLCPLPGVSRPKLSLKSNVLLHPRLLTTALTQFLQAVARWWGQRPVVGFLDTHRRTQLLYTSGSTVDVWNQGRYGAFEASPIYRLSDVETFFLAWALKVLKVQRSLEDSSHYSHPSLWKALSQPSSYPSGGPTFQERYIAYHHYRSLGWCVRPGARYGCDYALYPSDLTQYHSSYLVLLLPSSGPNRSFWSLRHIYTTLRVTTQVNKDTSCPETTLSFSTLSDVLLSRWIPEQDR